MKLEHPMSQPGSGEAGPTAAEGAPEQVEVRVLVVEDDPLQRRFIDTLFKAANEPKQGCPLPLRFVTTVVSSAQEALRTLRDRTFQLILIDVIMPDMSGAELLPLVRKAVASTTAVLMVSAVSRVDVVERCVRDKADAFLPKPLGIDTVRTIWQYCLQRDPHLFLPCMTQLPGAEGAADGEDTSPRLCERAVDTPDELAELLRGDVRALSLAPGACSALAQSTAAGSAADGTALSDGPCVPSQSCIDSAAQQLMQIRHLQQAQLAASAGGSDPEAPSACARQAEASLAPSSLAYSSRAVGALHAAAGGETELEDTLPGCQCQ